MSDSPSQVGFVAPDASDLAPFFPGYEIQGLIATGGMGAVYGAVQKSLERTVAIKILPTELSKDAAFCAGFEAEAKAMARLNHPNLIGVYDFGEVNGMLFIIMEFVPGQSIYHSAYGIAIDPKEVIRLVTGICDGLAHAHENGILHRDIKPSNILLDLNAQPKIGDFGLARPIERKIEEGEEIFGTPHYTAPEVVDAPHTVDYRADIFSVGVLLHELLTGKLPADDPRPASVISRCSPRFDAIIRRATQPLPSARYASAKELAADLRAIEASMTLGSPRTTPQAGPRPARQVRRPIVRKKQSSGMMSIVLVLLVLCGGYAAYVHFSKPVVPVVVLPVEPPPIIVQPSKPMEAAPEPELAVPTPEATVETAAPPVAAPESAPEGEMKEEPTPQVQVAPKSDVPAFFTRARKVMQEKALPAISLYKANSKTNLDEFEDDLTTAMRKVKVNGERVDEQVKPLMAGIRAEGAKLPENVNDQLSMVPDIETLSSPFLARQVGIEDTLNESLSQLSKTYVLGLELQIKRLQGENDPGAVALVQQEIQDTQADSTYFRNLILGAK
jgi:serine/threonine protein kinase